jgi:hypothetical protein
MGKVFVRLDLAYISGMVWKDNCSGDGCVTKFTMNI